MGNTSFYFVFVENSDRNELPSSRKDLISGEFHVCFRNQIKATRRTTWP